MVLGLDEEPPRRRTGRGYALIALVLVALLAAVVVLPMLDLINAAPPVVTDQAIVNLESQPAAPGSVDSGHAPRLQRRGRGMSICTRDQALYRFAGFIHLPRSQLLRIEYSTITDCHLRRD